MKVAVIGANGQLGSDICASIREDGGTVYAINHEQVDVRDFDGVWNTLKDLALDGIVNTAAFHHVERCEADPEKAFGVNAIGTRNVAIVAERLNVMLVHVSTDYVFDGKKRAPYLETDEPLPLNVYGHSKLSGELFVRTVCHKHLVMRLSALYGKEPCRAKGLNFVELMLKLARERGELRVIDSEIVSPTWTVDVARQVVKALRAQPFGVSHATAEGSCSWFEFARAILDYAGVSARLSVAEVGEFPAKTPRPAYSVLENEFLKQRGINVLRPWQDGLREYIAAR